MIRSRVVYAGTDEQASTAVQPTANGGVRFLTVIDGPEAPTEFRFTLDTRGAGYGITEDGRLATIAADGSPIAQLEAPWATDADDNAVPVSYRIDAATLVMEVHHAGASYPVVADPWWNPFSWGGGDPSSCSSNRSLCNCYNGLRGNIAGAVYFGFTANETSTLRSLVGAGALSARNLNWSTDSCSAVGKFSNGIMLGSFGNACGKHDFGYRNTRAIFGRRHEDDRKVIDNQFRRDMQDTCTQFGIVATARTGICYGDAEATYRGVRQFGEKFYAA